MSEDTQGDAGEDRPGAADGPSSHGTPSWPSAPGEQPATAPPVATHRAAPAPGWSAPPVPAAKKSRVGLVVGLVVGALLVVGAVVVGVVVLASSESFPDDDQEGLIRAIPGEPRAAACKAITVEGARAAVSCRVRGGADVVTAAQFDGITGANEGFAEEEAFVEGSGTDGDCIDRNEVVHDYETIDGEGGRALCYRRRGRSVIAWTSPGAGIVLRATRGDKQDLQLYRWWADGIQRRFPTVDQLVDLKAVAPEGFDDCEWFYEKQAATVAIRCTDDNGLRLYYNQFDDSQDLLDEYVSQVDDDELGEGENAEAGTCPFEAQATTGGEPTGRVFCAIGADGAPKIVYTDEPSGLLIEVYGSEGDAADALVAEWRIGAFDPET
ncbi:MAG: hypothetical protein ACXW1S_10835 [Acidimicrobiia bacterium]